MSKNKENSRKMAKWWGCITKYLRKETDATLKITDHKNHNKYNRLILASQISKIKEKL